MDRTATIDVLEDVGDHSPRWVSAPMLVMQWVGAVAVIGLVVNVIADVVARNVFNSPFVLTIELVQFWWMPVSAYAGMAFAQYVNEHVVVETLFSTLTPAMNRLLRRVVLAVGALYSAVLAYFGLENAISDAQIGAYSAATRLATWPPEFIVPIAMASLAICFAWQAIRLPGTTYARGGALNV